MISDITLRDRTAFEIYRTRAADAIHTYEGRYLARLGEAFALEVRDTALSRNLILVDGVPLGMVTADFAERDWSRDRFGIRRSRRTRCDSLRQVRVGC
jgi:hypothetical protein